MIIPTRQRQGQRNEYKRRRSSAVQFTDLSTLVVTGFSEELKSALPEDVDFIYHNSSAIPFNHTKGRAAYLMDLFPLDVVLQRDEVDLIEKATSESGNLDRLEILWELLSVHVNNIVEEVKRVKLYHPESKLSIAFAPADTLDYSGTPARPIYAFMLKSDGLVKLETESSFVIIPNDEVSKAYMVDQP